jgi:hypothetical protein
MRITMMTVILFFIANAAVFAQSSGSHGDSIRPNDGTAQTHSALPSGAGNSENLNHGGLMTPHTTNDRGVIPANPSTDEGMPNPGHSQNFITHTKPKS